MNKYEFSKAFEIAKSGREFDSVEIEESLIITYGCGLPEFEPVHVDLDTVAILIRYQAQYMNGHWDYTEIDQLAKIARYKFIAL